MIELIKIESWKKEILEDRTYIEQLLQDLTQEQLADLVSSVHKSEQKEKLAKIHRGFLINKILLKSARIRFVYTKIEAPFSFLKDFDYEAGKQSQLNKLLQMHNIDYRTSSLIMLLQNYYDEALVYYYLYLKQEDKLEDVFYNEFDILQIENLYLRSQNTILTDRIKQEEKRIEEISQHNENQNEALLRKVEKQEREIRHLNKLLLEHKIDPNQELHSASKNNNQSDPNLKEVVQSIIQTVPNSAIDIFESLDLLKDTLDQTINELSEKLNNIVVSRQFTESKYLVDLAKSINYYEERLKHLLMLIDISNLDDDRISNNDIERDIPDYELYIVSNDIEHTLYEDFTHKRPHSFQISNGERIDARTWRDMLISTANILYKTDSNKFHSFIQNPKMNGRRNQYFKYDSEQMWNPVKIGDIYMETAGSANSIRNLIMKLLNEYHFNTSDYKIFLRADYTDLHIDDVNTRV